jgi:hypothetical protein
MEAISRTIPMHVIHAAVVKFDAVSNQFIPSDIPDTTIYGGETCTEADALKVITKDSKFKNQPVVIKSVDHSLNVYEMPLDTFMKYAENKGAPKVRKPATEAAPTV